MFWVPSVVVEMVRFCFFLKIDLTGFATCSCMRNPPETDQARGLRFSFLNQFIHLQVDVKTSLGGLHSI